MRRVLRAARNVLLAVAACLGLASGASGQGLIVPGAGPINRSMGGASTAAPIEFGSTYWNPANLSGLDRQEFLLGSELILPSIHLRSQIPAGAIAGRFPQTGRAGTSRSDSGVASNLATGAAFRLSDDSPWTYGIGVFGLVGGGVNFAGSPTMPILAPRRFPRYFGVGPIYANLSLLTINPMASRRLSERLSIGGGPVISTGTASFNPAFFAPANRDEFGLARFPAATNARPFWGGGFQLGALLELNEAWNFGFSYKSPIWQERWAYNAANPDLSARRIGIQAQIPAIYSWGIAYKGLPGALIDVDLRYLDYANTSLFGQKVIDGGLGWKGVFAVATGAQYALTERLTVRGGYLYNTNPIPAPVTLFNTQAPAITEHTLSLGASLAVTPDLTFSAGWVHGFRNSITGPIGEIPGASVALDTQTDSIVAGLNLSFGPRRGDRRAAPDSLPALPQ